MTIQRGGYKMTTGYSAEANKAPRSRSRARDSAIPFNGIPGPTNSITDVPGVEVGMATLIHGNGLLGRGHRRYRHSRSAKAEWMRPPSGMQS